jgi:hypothetical protein
MTRVIVRQRFSIRRPPRSTIVCRVRLDDATNTGSHRHVTMSRFVSRFPYTGLDNTLSREAAVSLPAIRKELYEIRPDPLVSLLEIVARPRFRRCIRPSVLQVSVSRRVDNRRGKRGKSGGGNSETLNKNVPIHHRPRYLADW